MATKTQSGYILVLTLSLITFFVFLTTYVFNQSFVFFRFTKTMADREKARQLAFGGIELMRDFLCQKTPQEQKETLQNGQVQPGQQPKPAAPASSENGKFLKQILEDLNRNQTFDLKKAIEGVDGTLSMILFSEEGKIDINKMYNFEKHQFIGQGQPAIDMRVFMQEFFKLLEERVKVNLFDSFEKFLKDRKVPLNDVTELLTIKEFEFFRNTVFFNPFDDKTAYEKIFLTDLFTVASSGKGIEPWLISHSLAAVLKFSSQKDRKAGLEQALKAFKENSVWKNDWNKTLKLVYGVDFAALPKNIAVFFTSAFTAKSFSVICQAKVGQASVTFFAILERKMVTRNKETNIEVSINKIYLI